MTSRREFLSGLTLAGAAGLFGLRADPAAAEPPPETTTLRLLQSPSLCQAPQYVAESLLQAEGFTDVRYLKLEGTGAETIAAGQIDITLSFVGPQILAIDAGAPIVLIAGGHVGCYELFGTDRVRTVRDLKGKTVAVRKLGSTEHVFLSSMAAHVGLDPRRDVNWVLHPPAQSARLLEAGTIDAFMAFPPQAQEFRAKKVGHVIVNSALDRPWSQYFCCMV